MSDHVAAAQSRAPTPRVEELRVTAHMMTLDHGLFCILSTPVPGGDISQGLPGVRLSLPPGPAGRPDAVTIRGFADDGWLSATGDAALVRVTSPTAQLMVTIYQAKDAVGGAPNIQVMRLGEGDVAAPPAMAQAAPAPAEPAPATVPRTAMDLVAHVQGAGDVGCMLGEWMGAKGSKTWIEGFVIAPTKEVLPADVEYQAVLGRGWLSPWAEGGQFCGSRGMALPVLGLRMRLRGAAAETHECFYSASFVDGSAVGPVPGGEACESESLAPLESFQIIIQRRGQAVPQVEAKAAAKPTPKAVKSAKPAAKPTPTKPTPTKPTPTKPTLAKPAPKAGKPTKPVKRSR